MSEGVTVQYSVFMTGWTYFWTGDTCGRYYIYTASGLLLQSACLLDLKMKDGGMLQCRFDAKHTTH